MSMFNNRKAEKVEESLGSFSVYSGVGEFTPILVNPTAEELREVMDIQLKKAPEYITRNDKGQVTDIRITIYGTLTDKEGYTVNHNLSLFLKRRIMENNPNVRDVKGLKYQYIDRFGNTTWLGEGETTTAKHRFDPSACHKAFEGEATLINLLKAFYPTENVFDYDAATGTYSLHKDIPAEAEWYLSSADIKDIFNGNISAILKMFKDCASIKNSIKILTGIKDSNSYPITYMDFLSNKYSLDNAIKRYTTILSKANLSGNVQYSLSKVHEVSANATTNVDTDKSTDDMPAAPTGMNASDDDDLPF